MNHINYAFVSGGYYCSNTHLAMSKVGMIKENHAQKRSGLFSMKN